MWTSRDLDIVETLTRRVRVLSRRQIDAIWWPANSRRRTSVRRLQRLVRAGLLNRTTINAIQGAPATAPLLQWSPEQPGCGPVTIAEDPGFALSVPTEVYSATRFAANLFGCNPLPPPDVENINPGLGLSDVYLRYVLDRPVEAGFWRICDASFAGKHHAARPAALVTPPDGRSTRAIGIVCPGNHSPAESLHDFCTSQSLPYEIWSVFHVT